MFIRLLLYTGIREAEASGLEWRDIDFENWTVSIRRTSQYIPGKGMIQSTPKSKSSFRILPVSDDMMNELIMFRKWQVEEMGKLGPLYEGKKGDDARLFTTLTGRPVYDSTLRKWLNVFLKWCDVPRVTVHGLRHTFASVMIANGVDPRTTAALLGQSSPALVMNVYANAQDEAKARAVDKLSRIYKNEKSS